MLHFELLDGQTQRRLRNTKTLSRPVEVQVLGDGKEAAKYSGIESHEKRWRHPYSSLVVRHRHLLLAIASPRNFGRGNRVFNLSQIAGCQLNAKGYQRFFELAPFAGSDIRP
jgi:hypothetical protein